MTKAVIARAELDKALCQSLAEGASRTAQTFPAVRSFPLFPSPLVRTAGAREQTRRKCLTQIPANSRRCP
jgi:hypothetical protein